MLEGSLVSWPRGDEVVVLLQLWYAEIGGVVGQEDVASPQYTQSLWHGKWQRGWYWRALRGVLLAACLGVLMPWLHAAPRKAQVRLSKSAGQTQGRRDPWIEAHNLLDEKMLNQTYQVTWQLPGICVCESDHVVSYCTSQSHLRLHARVLRLRTFVQERNGALQFPPSVNARARPRHIQIVKHCHYGGYCA